MKPEPLELQIRWKAYKSEGGGAISLVVSNVVGTIFPLVEIESTDLTKSEGVGAIDPPGSAVPVTN